MGKKRAQSEDDGLSYSSTEHDVSQHEEHISPKHTPLNLSGANSGKLNFIILLIYLIIL